MSAPSTAETDIAGDTLRAAATDLRKLAPNNDLAELLAAWLEQRVAS